MIKRLFLFFVVVLSVGCVKRGMIAPVRVQEEIIPGYKATFAFGRLGTEEGKFDHPTDITIGRDGRLYITDTGNCRISVFSSRGEPQGSFGERGEGPGCFRRPRGICSFGRSIYVVDAIHNTLSKFTEKGKFISSNLAPCVVLTEEGKLSTLKQGFRELTDVAVCPYGRVYVVEGDQTICVDERYIYLASKDKVKIFDRKTLSLVVEFGRWGRGYGEVMFPLGISVDREGHIFIADTLNHRIQKFDKNGRFLTSFGQFGSAIGELKFPTGVAINEFGEAWVVDSGNHRIQKFIPHIKVLKEGIEATGNWEWLYNKARQYYGIGKYYHAMAFFARALELKKDSVLAPACLFFIAECYKRLGNDAEALGHYRRVVKEYPTAKEAPRALWEEAELLYRLDLLTDAISCYEKIVKVYEKSPQRRKAEKRLKELRLLLMPK